MPEWSARHELASKRLRSILRSHVVASDRILEQKISDAGPTNQRVDPHILTEARSFLTTTGVVAVRQPSNVPWYYLESSPDTIVSERLSSLGALHHEYEKLSP